MDLPVDHRELDLIVLLDGLSKANAGLLAMLGNNYLNSRDVNLIILGPAANVAGPIAAYGTSRLAVVGESTSQQFTIRKTSMPIRKLVERAFGNDARGWPIIGDTSERSVFTQNTYEAIKDQGAVVEVAFPEQGLCVVDYSISEDGKRVFWISRPVKRISQLWPVLTNGLCGENLP